MENIWRLVSFMKREEKEFCAGLYLSSSSRTVHDEMAKVIDVLIERMLTNPQEGVGVDTWHDLLYLCDFGGRLTLHRTDVAGLTYEFNTRSAKGYVPASPWEYMEDLFEKELADYPEEEGGRIRLTVLGTAVLKRLDEECGPCRAEKMFVKDPVTAQGQPVLH